LIKIESKKTCMPSTYRRNAIRTGFCLLGMLLTLGPLNSKILGAAWLGFCIWGLWVAFRTRHTPPNPETVQVASAAASIWLRSCITALALTILCALIWPENSETLNAQLRLLLAAGAAAALLRRGGLSLRARTNIFHIITIACILAFAWAAFWTMRGADVRDLLASNAIPWAVAISFYPCLLVPIALAEDRSAFKRRIWLFGSACGIGAVLLSQSRGAFLVILWCGLVYAWFWHHRKYASRIGFHRTLLLLFCAVTILLAGAWWGPGDVLRMRQAAQDITQFRTAENYNTSIGARLYLWEMAWKGIQQSPWIGIGGTERLRRIKQAGDGESENPTRFSEIHSLGHVHNQYLHSAWDGGVIGLGAFLALLIGMAIAIRRLTPIDPVAGWQLGGVLFMHATSNLTNVNFAHNYYALALSLATVVPLLCAYQRSVSE
jgi:O-antigen ligase